MEAVLFRTQRKHTSAELLLKWKSNATVYIHIFFLAQTLQKITCLKEPKRERNNRSKSSVFLSTRRLVFQSVSLEISLISFSKSINLLKFHLKNRPYGFQILIKPMNSILNGSSNSKHVSINNNHTVHYLSTENQKTFKVI